jgi:hypothetical protein
MNATERRPVSIGHPLAVISLSRIRRDHGVGEGPSAPTTKPSPTAVVWSAGS